MAKDRIPPTGKTREVLYAVVAFWAKHGYSPSLRDLGMAVGRAPSVVSRHLAHLRRDGWITYDDGISRSIRLGQ